MQHLPTVEHLALEKLLTSDGQGEVSASSLKEKGASQVKGEGVREALSGVVRSKGFIWLASSDTLCYQWSHAGRTFEMQLLGLWWDVRDREDWPEEFEEQILRDFEGEFGDRRQQLVFIGTSVADPKLRNELEDALDAALLTDAELEAYTQEREKGGQGGKGKAKRGRPRKSDGFQKLFPMPSLLAESIDRYQLEA
uniref:CobW C-terminal domain-containing protein n=1 Tax=Chromera velia CCMP2878 TaxID=1169474 RepID=A0A0G4HWR3_9ALVE|eukprot:Cvel_9128.t1-p1 / transcript=Cvel_9128.t1 / gene=Cvel_9128 / organism=Chromera_velia_CCMP2878 / gene_product=COBW domain-containing protein DDB_G0274527, putative / transcript_product=COBW domain-containing protein DDB_G0274527, putative / location=Cvel_scaffold519:14148-17284(-) / protein_length=195 / sequence_SO=supercontig / SO=protein_coding / is_pseudo=false